MMTYQSDVDLTESDMKQYIIMIKITLEANELKNNLSVNG